MGVVRNRFQYLCNQSIKLMTAVFKHGCGPRSDWLIFISVLMQRHGLPVWTPAISYCALGVPASKDLMMYNTAWDHASAAWPPHDGVIPIH